MIGRYVFKGICALRSETAAVYFHITDIVADERVYLKGNIIAVFNFRGSGRYAAAVVGKYGNLEFFLSELIAFLQSY